MPTTAARSFTSNAFLALFVVSIAIMLLVPLPTMALDFLLALNISFAFLLLLVGLYMPNALALLSFPSILLLSTLFRLSLNVASTRLILSQGDAGTVIQAFGSFLIQGEIVVGVIIFIIITVVNFVVIARGASRVSEVAARFALDALPGKQMAIDGDLRAGNLTPQQAEERRDKLRKESQLYGSMDGSMKFVQGDAIAGFFIIFTNILGGMYMGVQHGMSFSEAVQTYVMLTVGDGLVSQIPALLTSICAGIVVTRVSSGENTTLGADLSAQLFQNPGLLLLTAGVVVIIASLPGIPFLPFMSIAVIFTTAAFFIARRNRMVKPGEIQVQRYRALDSTGNPLPGLPEGTGNEIIAEAPMERISDARIGIDLDSRVLFRMYNEQAGYYRERWAQLQNDFYQSTGLQLPTVAILPNSHLPRGGFQLTVGGSVVIQDEIAVDTMLVEAVPDIAESFGFEVYAQDTHPLNGISVFWTPASITYRRIADAAEMRVFDPVEYIFLRSAAFLRAHPEEILTITEVHQMLKKLESEYPGLIEEALGGSFMNVARVTDVLQEIAREGIPIRDIRQVFEAIASYCSTYNHSMVQNDDFDLQDIVSYVRTNRKRQAVAGLTSYRGTLRLCSVSSGVESIFSDVRYDSGARSIALDVEQFEQLRRGLQAVITPVRRRGVFPVAVLVPPELRHKITAFIRSCNDTIRVVTFDELDPAMRVEPVGVWSVS